jgi:sugar phosphate isomerase/epimerase
MMSENGDNDITRRTFLWQGSVWGVGMAMAGYSGDVGAIAQAAESTTNWAHRIGIGLYSVRDLMTDSRSYQDTLAKLAELGYKEVEPADRTDSKGKGYAGLDPKAFRAFLDSHGLSMPSTHSSAIEGPDLERQLEGFEIMGIKYTEVIAPSDPHAPKEGRVAPPAPDRRSSGKAAGSSMPAAKTMDAVMRTVDRLNAHAQITRKFGVKMLVRMDLDVFVPLSDQPDKMPFEVIADRTDPAAVAMQIDIGWAAVAGQDIVGMFRRNRGRYELWHIKDAVGIHEMTAQMNLGERRLAAYFVPVGLGQIDLKTIFASAELAGLRHFGIEQDNAATWGDSLGAARVNEENLVKMLS